MSLFMYLVSIAVGLLFIATILAWTYTRIMREITKRKRQACESLIPALLNAAETHILAHGNIMATEIVRDCLTILNECENTNRTSWTPRVSLQDISRKLASLKEYILKVTYFLEFDTTRQTMDPRKECANLVRFGLSAAVAAIDHAHTLSRPARQLMEHGREAINLNKDLSHLDDTLCAYRHAQLALLELRLNNYKIFY